MSIPNTYDFLKTVALKPLGPGLGLTIGPNGRVMCVGPACNACARTGRGSGIVIRGPSLVMYDDDEDNDDNGYIDDGHVDDTAAAVTDKPRSRVRGDEDHGFDDHGYDDHGYDDHVSMPVGSPGSYSPEHPILAVTTDVLKKWANDYDAFMQFWMRVGLYKDPHFTMDGDLRDEEAARGTTKIDRFVQRGEHIILAHSRTQYRQFKKGSASCGDMDCINVESLDVPPELLWATLSQSPPAKGESMALYLANEVQYLPSQRDVSGAPIKGKKPNGLAITLWNILKLAVSAIREPGTAEGARALAVFRAMKAVNEGVRLRSPPPPKGMADSLTCIARALLYVLSSYGAKDSRDSASTYDTRNLVYQAFANFVDPRMKNHELAAGGRSLDVLPAYLPA
jgi:hypothetical protein